MNIRQARKIHNNVWKKPRRSIVYKNSFGELVLGARIQLDHTPGQFKRSGRKLRKNSIRRWHKIMRWQTMQNRLIVLQDMAVRQAISEDELIEIAKAYYPEPPRYIAGPDAERRIWEGIMKMIENHGKE